MISGSPVECQPENAALARVAAAHRDAMRERIANALCPFAEPHDLRRLARHLAAVMQGVSIQARDGATPAELQEVVEDVVSGVAARLAVEREH